MFRLRVVPVELAHGVRSLQACGGQGHELGIRSRDPLARVHLQQNASVLAAALALLIVGVVRHIPVQVAHQIADIGGALERHDQQGLNHAIQFRGQVVQVDGGSVKHGGFLWAVGPVGFQVSYPMRGDLSTPISKFICKTDNRQLSTNLATPKGGRGRIPVRLWFSSHFPPASRAQPRVVRVVLALRGRLVGVVLVRGHHADFARADDAVADHLGSVLAADVGHSLGVNRPGAFALFQQGQQVASHREGQHDLNDGRKVERVGEVVGGVCHAGSLTDAARKVNRVDQIFRFIET